MPIKMLLEEQKKVIYWSEEIAAEELVPFRKSGLGIGAGGKNNQYRFRE
jgi:hypothetical protein